MRRAIWTLLCFSGGAAALLAVHLAAAQTHGPHAGDPVPAPRPAAAVEQPPDAERFRDMGKYAVETPLKAVLASTVVEAAAHAEADVRSAPAAPAEPAAVEPAPESGDAAAAPPAAAEQPEAPRPRRDMGKRRVETPLKAVLASAAVDPLAPATQTPAESAVPGEPAASAAAAAPGAPAPPVPPAVAAPEANPMVAPGDVRWHDGFDAACAAAGRSGRPVLLFQLIGRLDQRFT